MRLDAVNEINREDNVTESEQLLTSRELHGYRLYVHHLFENRRQEAAQDIDNRRTGTIVSNLSRDNAAVDDGSIGSSLGESEEEPIIAPIIILPAENSIENPMVMALKRWKLENMFVQRA